MWSCTVFQSYFVTASVGDEVPEAFSALSCIKTWGALAVNVVNIKTVLNCCQTFELANLWKGVF